jgi:predicted flap endonuclease-1-like 5' DNA nuclease
VPKLHEVPGLSSATANALVAANLESPFRVARLSASEIATATGLNMDDAARASDVIRLTLLRGIGAAHAERLIQNGISSMCELSHADPSVIWNRFQLLGQARPTQAEVRVWVRAAELRCAVPRP